MEGVPGLWNCTRGGVRGNQASTSVTKPGMPGERTERNRERQRLGTSSSSQADKVCGGDLAGHRITFSGWRSDSSWPRQHQLPGYSRSKAASNGTSALSQAALHESWTSHPAGQAVGAVRDIVERSASSRVACPCGYS